MVNYNTFKGSHAQQCLLSIIEKWRRSFEGGHTGAFLADLSKAFGCLNHNALTAKSHTYVPINRDSLNFSIT